MEADREDNNEATCSKRPRLEMSNKRDESSLFRKSIDEIDASQVMPQERINRSTELNPLLNKMRICETTRNNESRLALRDIDISTLSRASTTGSLNNTTLRNLKMFKKVLELIIYIHAIKNVYNCFLCFSNFTGRRAKHFTRRK